MHQNLVYTSPTLHTYNIPGPFHSELGNDVIAKGNVRF